MSLTLSSSIETQQSLGKSSNMGTRNCRQPFQWPRSNIRHIKLNIRMNFPATARNCNRKKHNARHKTKSNFIYSRRDIYPYWNRKFYWIIFFLIKKSGREVEWSQHGKKVISQTFYFVYILCQQCNQKLLKGSRNCQHNLKQCKKQHIVLIYGVDIYK